MVIRQNPSTGKARQSIIELVLRKCMQVDVRTVKRLLFRDSIVTAKVERKLSKLYRVRENS